MTTFDRITLISGDRAIAAGGTQTGKSTLAAGSPEYEFKDTLLGDWIRRYANKNDGGKCLIVDTKPRFHAAHNIMGLSDNRRYKRWDYGPEIPNSTRVDPGNLQDFERAMNLSDIIIVQSDEVDKDAPLMLALVVKFIKSAGLKHKRFVYFDEIMDFYTQTGNPVRGCGNIALRCARAGAEKGVTVLYASQRCKGIPSQLWELINKLYLFRLDMGQDLQRIRECGIPYNMIPPEIDHIFKFWTKKERRQVYGPYRLRLSNTKRSAA